MYEPVHAGGREANCFVKHLRRLPSAQVPAFAAKGRKHTQERPREKGTLSEG